MVVDGGENKGRGLEESNGHGRKEKKTLHSQVFYEICSAIFQESIEGPISHMCRKYSSLPKNG